MYERGGRKERKVRVWWYHRRVVWVKWKVGNQSTSHGLPLPVSILRLKARWTVVLENASSCFSKSFPRTVGAFTASVSHRMFLLYRASQLARDEEELKVTTLHSHSPSQLPYLFQGYWCLSLQGKARVPTAGGSSSDRVNGRPR